MTIETTTPTKVGKRCWLADVLIEDNDGSILEQVTTRLCKTRREAATRADVLAAKLSAA